MNNFIFENTAKCYFGRGCVREYLASLAAPYGKTVLLCYGGEAIRKNGVYDEVTACLAKAGKEVAELSGIGPGPGYAKVLQGAKLARESGAALILGVGGGSVMDCCKAISLAAVYGGDAWADFWVRPGVVDFAPLPLGVVVTAAGSGSEMNGAALLTDEKRRQRIGRDYPACSPRFALLDPCYSFGMPKRQLLAGGFETLARIMECYFSAPDEPNPSDDLAEALMRGVIRDLRAAARDPADYTARSNLLWASAMAGSRVFRLGKRTDAACRQMGCQLAAYTGCEDGEALAVLYPAYCRHIYRDAPARFRHFAVGVWGIAPGCKCVETLARAGVEALACFVRELGLPTTLREVGVDESADLKEIADSCSISCGGYRKMTHDEIRKIFQECF